MTLSKSLTVNASYAFILKCNLGSFVVKIKKGYEGESNCDTWTLASKGNMF